jgi:hypothetical protein
MKKDMLVKGKKAATPKGMQHNYDVMRDAGYSKSRSAGAAYGEVGLEKADRRHEREGMMKYDDLQNMIKKL